MSITSQLSLNLSQLHVSDSSIGAHIQKALATFSNTQAISDDMLKQQFVTIFTELKKNITTLPGSEVLFTTIFLIIIGEKIHEKHDLKALLFILDDIFIPLFFDNPNHNPHFDDLYNNLSWISAFSSVYQSNADFSTLMAQLSSCWKILQSNKGTTPSNLDPRHPQALDKRSSFHDWYALCYWLHLTFPQLLNEDSECIKRCSSLISDWMNHPQQGPAPKKIVQVSAMLAIFRQFLGPFVENTQQEQKPSVFSRLRGALSPRPSSLTVASPAISPRDRRFSLSETSTVPKHTRPASQTVTAVSSLSPQRATPFNKTPDNFIEFCKQHEDENVCFELWFSCNEAHILLSKLEMTNAGLFLDILRSKYEDFQYIGRGSMTGQGVSWITSISTHEACILQHLLATNTFPEEKRIHYLPLIHLANKVDISSRLDLTIAMANHLTEINSNALKQLYSSINLYYMEANDQHKLKIWQLLQKLLSLQCETEISSVKSLKQTFDVFLPYLTAEQKEEFGIKSAMQLINGCATAIKNLKNQSLISLEQKFEHKKNLLLEMASQYEKFLSFNSEAFILKADMLKAFRELINWRLSNNTQEVYLFFDSRGTPRYTIGYCGRNPVILKEIPV